jgi:hypothetical protein
MFKCVHCQRNYQRKIYFERHVITCEFLSKSKRETTLEFEELADTPSVRELYSIIMGLASKCKQLETKLDAISKWTNITKQKLNIIDWLNTNHTSANLQDYTAWFNAITIGPAHLEYLFETDYVEGVVAFLKERLPPNNNNDVRPLRAFTSKENVFYLYQQAEKKWVHVDQETFNKLMYLLDKLFMGQFIAWQNANKHKITSDDFPAIYSANMKKIMGGNNTREQLYSRIKKELYMYIRSEPPNILEYEVTF